MKEPALPASVIALRQLWLTQIEAWSAQPAKAAARLEDELAAAVKAQPETLLWHLRLCGVIPEHYGYDSSAEKLYSKYTDVLLALSFRRLGLQSVVLRERADAADVEAVIDGYSVVADAKAFRLSRTAKNQKDFKVQAMDGWKRGKPFALVVCPSYQLPAKSSQIYQQAIAREVCVFTYSHLACLVAAADALGQSHATASLESILRTTRTLHPAKEAAPYWRAINGAMLDCDASIASLWRNEKTIALSALQAAKEEALSALAKEREAILRMSHDQALAALLTRGNLQGREAVIRKVGDNGLLAMERA